MIKSIYLFVCVLLLSFSIYPKGYYVSTIKTGNNDGSNWSNAWNDFGSINWSKIIPGDTLFISGGVDTAWYNDTLITKSKGDSLKYITITIGNDAGHKGVAVIKSGMKLTYGQNYYIVDGKNRMVICQQEHYGVFIYSSNNIILKNLEVLGLPTTNRVKGVYILNECYFIRLSNCFIHAASDDAININVGQKLKGDFPDSFCGLYIIEDCLIDSSADDGLQVNADRVTVRNSILRRVPPTAGGIDPRGGHPDGIQTGFDRGYMAFYNNTFVNYEQAIFTESAGRNIKVFNNIFYDIPNMNPDNNTNRFIAMSKTYSDTIPNQGYFIVANNVFYQSLWNAILFYDPIFKQSDSLIFRNNIFINCKRWIAEDEPFPYKVIQDDNVFFTTGDASPPAQSIPVGLTVLNPKFSDYKNYDFTLKDDSELIGAGKDLSAYFDFDREGNKRPNGSGWDIGPYQKVTSSDPRDQSKGVRLIKK